MFHVYEIISPNSKVYFNYSVDPEKRWNNGWGFHSNKALQADIKRYGWSAFQKLVIESFDDENIAKQAVANLIATNQANDPTYGYNCPVKRGSSTEAQIIARGLRKPIYQCDLDDNVLVEYKSVNAAAAAVNGSPTTLSNCLHGRLKSYKGYHWHYASNEPIAQHVQNSQG